MDQMTVDHCPFDRAADLPAASIWVSPHLVARVEFKQWTKAARLRAPSFKGFVSDPAEEATWESEGPN